jgi:hypothetical protein
MQGLRAGKKKPDQKTRLEVLEAPVGKTSRGEHSRAPMGGGMRPGDDWDMGARSPKCKQRLSHCTHAINA